MPIYDVRPGALIETPNHISVEELEKAREKFDKGTPLSKIAAALGGVIPETRGKRPMVGVYLDALLDEVGDDEARLARLIGEDPARQLFEQRRQDEQA